MSLSGHGFEPENSHIQSSVYTVFWYPFLYKISNVKHWLPSVTWSFSRINFTVILICVSYKRNDVFLTENKLFLHSKQNQWIRYRGIFVVDCEQRTEHKWNMWRKQRQVFALGDTYSNHGCKGFIINPLWYRYLLPLKVM